MVNLDVFQKVQICRCYRLLCPDEGAVGLGLFFFSHFHPTCSFSTDRQHNNSCRKCSYGYVTSIFISLKKKQHTHTHLVTICRSRTRILSEAVLMVCTDESDEEKTNKEWSDDCAKRETLASVPYLLKLSYFGFVELRSVWVQELDGERTSCRRNITVSLTFSRCLLFLALAQLTQKVLSCDIEIYRDINSSA